MPISPNTASSPEGSAGEGGLKAAFESAVADVGLPDDSFHAAAGDPEPERTEEPEQPVEETEPEAKPAAKPIKVKAHVREQVAKTAAPVTEPALAAPANWDASRKAAFDKLPPEGRKVLLDMSKGLEAEYGKKSTELADAERYARSVYQIITPEHRNQMRNAGLKSDAEGLARLVALNDQATNDFPGYARWAMETYAGDTPIADVLQRIFPEAFTGTTTAQPGAQPAPRPPVDPITKQVHETLRAVMQRVDGLEHGNRQSQERSAEQVIAKFRTEADDAGNPKRPHLAHVEKQMIGLLQTPAFVQIEDMGERLQQAYDAAVALDPTIRQQFLDSEVQRRLAEQTKAADLAKAKRARAPINAAPSGPSSKPQKGIDGALRQAMNLHGI